MSQNELCGGWGWACWGVGLIHRFPIAAWSVLRCKAQYEITYPVGMQDRRLGCDEPSARPA